METKESDGQQKKGLELERNIGCLTRCYVLLNLEPKHRYETAVKKINSSFIGLREGQTQRAPIKEKMNTKKAGNSRSLQAGSTAECLRTRT